MKLKDRVKLGLRSYQQGQDIDFITDFIHKRYEDRSWKFLLIGIVIGYCLSLI